MGHASYGGGGGGGHEMYQHPPPPMQQQAAGWNPGASEFVPKSNLSAAAQEFVPRHMPRNTSQWAYQQQQQLYQQQQQQQQHTVRNDLQTGFEQKRFLNKTRLCPDISHTHLTYEAVI